MSNPQENFNLPNPEIGLGPPQSASNQEDKNTVENWKAEANRFLIFTGLFSTSIAVLISVSIQDIQQNPQDVFNFYLANIYRAILNRNGHDISPTAPPPPFSPPTHGIWVNSLWFLSLIINYICALLATFLHQWAWQYLKITQQYNPHERARIRAFFGGGVTKCLLPWTVGTLSTLLIISPLLFIAGLVVFTVNLL